MDIHPGDIPIIDVGALVDNSAPARNVARAIGLACRETGFFYVAGHGIAPALMRRVFALSQQFFALPLAHKERAAFSGPLGNRGWIRLGNEALDPGKPFDLKEGSTSGSSSPRTIRKFWPGSRSAAATCGPT